MNLQKLNPYRNKKLLAGAKDESCVRCGSHEGVSSCHYTGFRQHLYGKGRGIKCSDLMSAYLCSHCHVYFDVEFGGIPNNRTSMAISQQEHKDRDNKVISLSEEFLHCIALTNIRRIEQGLLKGE